MPHTWKYVGSASANPMGVEAFGLIAGLGFVLSFGYWCTDFLVVQRAMAAETMSAARRTPQSAASSEDDYAVYRDPARHCGAGIFLLNRAAAMHFPRRARVMTTIRRSPH